MFKKILLGSVMLVVTVIFIAQTTGAEASSSLGLIVSPPLVEKSVSPGESVSDVIKVTNPTTSVLSVSVSVKDFVAKGETGDRTFINSADNTSPYVLGKWISFDDKFTLGANESKDIEYSVNVPKDAEPGGHYAVILFSPTTNDSSTNDSSGAIIMPSVGPTLLITVNGDIKYNAKIKEFSTEKNFYLESKNKINFKTRFENNGSVHVVPTGNIVIKNTLGKTVSTIDVNKEKSHVLSDSIRAFNSSWEKSYGFGLYKATLTLNYGDGKTMSGDVSFWIIPWKETAGAIIIILIFVWVLSRLEWKKK